MIAETGSGRSCHKRNLLCPVFLPVVLIHAFNWRIFIVHIGITALSPVKVVDVFIVVTACQVVHVV